MAFKENAACFTSDVKFIDYAKCFVSKEASRFSKEDAEDASARVDFSAAYVSSLSANKHKQKAKEIKRSLKEETQRALSEESKSERFKDSTNTSGKKTSESSKDSKTDAAKKEALVESKRAARRTAVAKVLRAKGMMGNDLSTDKSTGNAFVDGNTGAIRVFTELINPATYLKQLFIKVAASLAPHIATVLTFTMVPFILITLMVAMFSSINTVSTTVTGFVSQFSGRGKILSENTLTDEEIEDIIAGSGAVGSQVDVLRFALSKVGYPYSQPYRTSGLYYDCSSLAFYSWQAAGKDISYGPNYPPTAAAEASLLYSNGTVVNSTRLDIKDMEPGDLIFYGGHDNGRFLGIYHVAIYVGNGECVEAYNEEHGIVYQTLRTKNIILVLRP